MSRDIVFCATAKSGLGHVRRLTNILTEIKRARPDVSVSLLCNAQPSALPGHEIALYEQIQIVDRTDMSRVLMDCPPQLVVVDTAVLPDLDQLQSRLCLVLRETSPGELGRFRLNHRRDWDLVLLPNPPDDWCPDEQVLGARQTQAVGWIYRTAADVGHQLGAVSEWRKVLVSSGGGGNAMTAEYLRRVLDGLFNVFAKFASFPYEVIQVLGPRAPATLQLPSAHRIITPDPNLNAQFPMMDLVVSTAGYNSVLELATTDVPSFLVPVPRSIDDQAARARRWAGRLGRSYDARGIVDGARWMSRILNRRHRRNPVTLGPSGATQAARLMLSELDRR